MIQKNYFGKRKDEFQGKIISEFARLKSKIYCLVSVDSEEGNKAKGVNKNFVKKRSHKEFADGLFNRGVVWHKMKRIQSKLVIIGTYDVCKFVLTCFDDKRYILDYGINTLVYFHKDVNVNKSG